jgi:molybdopterin synthase catalytic subunit
VTVRILYFAVLRDLVGLEHEDATLPPEVRSVRALGPWLEARHPALEGRLGAVRFAVDEAFADPGAPLHEGAVVALIPPVAGG